MATISYPTGTIEVAPNVYALVQEGGMTNAGIIVGDDGVVVVDALMTPALARHTISEVKRISNKPIRFLINTHYHGDHTFGNEFFRPSPIVSHVNCRNELITRWEAAIQRFSTNRPELADEFAKLTLTPPDVTFEDTLTIRLGDRPIELIYLGMAHTTGDILVYLPQERVIYAGDVAFHKVNPVAADGHVSSWINVLRKAMRLDASTVVPGHGSIGTKEDLNNLRDYFNVLRRETRRRYNQGMSADQAAQDIRVERYSSWLMPERIQVTVQRLYQEFRGEI